MTLESIVLPVIGVVTVKTASVVVDFLFNRLRKISATKQGKRHKELESLRGEVQDLKKRLDRKEQLETSDFGQVKVEIEKILKMQEQHGLKFITEEAYREWLSSRFDGLVQIRQPAQTFEINIWIEEGTIATPRDIDIIPKASLGMHRIGDKITILFRSSQDCYLHLINLGTSGKVTVLFPNLYFQDSFIRANRIHSIPGEGNPFEYKLSGPEGTERIKAIATTTKVDLVDLEFSGKEQIFYSTERTAAARDVDVVEKRIKDIPLTGWATATCEFDVR
ncbi:MAG: DUF4384 domain-containing protein [Dehalococcoidales bacterium]|nr:MAG: DUF4384 domain-containing protein [Dehalococcoidales bacterium]